MKSLILTAIIAIAVIACFALVKDQHSREAIAKPNEIAKPADIKADTLTCREINIVDDDGQTQITMLSRGSTNGIWLNGKKPNQGVAIVSTAGQPAFISVYNATAKNFPGGFQFAIQLDDDGRPLIQWQGKDGKIKIENLEALGR